MSRPQWPWLDYQPQWAVDFEQLAGRLYGLLGDHARAIDHVGSTAVPGLAAKDCVDIQVCAAVVDEVQQAGLLAAIGFRCRAEPWNRAELSGGQECRKLVFAPSAGARWCNVHLREEVARTPASPSLFRDWLRADEAARRAWGAFKLAFEGGPELDGGEEEHAGLADRLEVAVHLDGASAVAVAERSAVHLPAELGHLRPFGIGR